MRRSGGQWGTNRASFQRRARVIVPHVNTAERAKDALRALGTAAAIAQDTSTAGTVAKPVALSGSCVWVRRSGYACEFISQCALSRVAAILAEQIELLLHRAIRKREQHGVLV